MAVYVDKLRTHHHISRLGYRDWCHMLADTTEELLAMAKAIGLPQYAIQNQDSYKEHFDLLPRMRKKAVDRGAIEIGKREVASMLHQRKQK